MTSLLASEPLTLSIMSVFYASEHLHHELNMSFNMSFNMRTPPKGILKYMNTQATAFNPKQVTWSKCTSIKIEQKHDHRSLVSAKLLFEYFRINKESN